jgi:hypothetical protein
VILQRLKVLQQRGIAKTETLVPFFDRSRNLWLNIHWHDKSPRAECSFSVLDGSATIGKSLISAHLASSLLKILVPVIGLS